MVKERQAGLVGIVTGMVAGLATITPASGNVGAVPYASDFGRFCHYFMCGV